MDTSIYFKKTAYIQYSKGLEVGFSTHGIDLEGGKLALSAWYKCEDILGAQTWQELGHAVLNHVHYGEIATSLTAVQAYQLAYGIAYSLSIAH